MALLFSGPISRPEFAADFFNPFCAFRHFWVPFGKPFESLWLENGGPEKGSEKGQKKVTRQIGNGGCLPLRIGSSTPFFFKGMQNDGKRFSSDGRFVSKG